MINIRIGDPDTTITGVHGYRIEYTVKGAVAFFPEIDREALLERDGGTSGGADR
ncbi:MAG: hypothetical protein R3B51_03765 [Thermodesulfobacteriota bacterium]